MGLLGEIFSASDSLKRRVKGLLSDPIGYLQQLDDQAKNYNNNVRPVISGGSRSAGQGSSNFVLFDDQLPRIMEINGQATGTAPWKPGEWRGLLSP
jgi:hypothetical protein